MANFIAKKKIVEYSYEVMKKRGGGGVELFGQISILSCLVSLCVYYYVYIGWIETN